MGNGKLGRGWAGVYGTAAVLREASGFRCELRFSTGALNSEPSDAVFGKGALVTEAVHIENIATNRRDFLIRSAAATAGFAARSMAANLAPSSQPKGSAGSMDFVNPELRPALWQVSQFLSRLTYNDASPPELRRLMGHRRPSTEQPTSRLTAPAQPSSLSHSRVNPSAQDIDFLFRPGSIARHRPVIQPPEYFGCMLAYIAARPQIEHKAHRLPIHLPE